MLKFKIWKNSKTPICYVYNILHNDGDNYYETNPFDGKYFFSEIGLLNYLKDNSFDESQLDGDIEFRGLVPDCYCNLYRKHIRKYLYKNNKRSRKILMCSIIRYLQWNYNFPFRFIKE